MCVSDWIFTALQHDADVGYLQTCACCRTNIYKSYLDVAPRTSVHVRVKTHTHTHKQRQRDREVRPLGACFGACHSSGGVSCWHESGRGDVGGVTCAGLEARQQQKIVINVRTSSCLLVTTLLLLLPEAPNGFTRISHPVEMKRNLYGTKQNC